VCLDRKEAPDSIDLAGSETLTYAEITELLASLASRPRPILRVPMPVARGVLEGIRTLAGPGVSATGQEVELMQVSMASPPGPADLRSLGIEPDTMAAVLAGGA
ncbi:MAG: hypothetical protein ACKORM_00400, partial [Solirubrobacterales bacterium]